MCCCTTQIIKIILIIFIHVAAQCSTKMEKKYIKYYDMQIGCKYANEQPRNDTCVEFYKERIIYPLIVGCDQLWEKYNY